MFLLFLQEYAEVMFVQSLIVSVTLICKFNFFLSRYACPVCRLDSRCLWWLKEQCTDCLIDKALMTYLKIHSSWLVPRLQLVSRRSTKLGGCFPKGTCQITAKTTTNFDSHLFIELIEDHWLFDLKKHTFTRNCCLKLVKLGSLSNIDDDGNKNPTNLHI